MAGSFSGKRRDFESLNVCSIQTPAAKPKPTIVQLNYTQGQWFRYFGDLALIELIIEYHPDNK